MEIMTYPKEIQLFFNEIVDKIKEVLDPEYILIAGSFGKESWLYFNKELISDFEFTFVCRKRWSLKKKSQLLRILNIDYPFEINLKGFLLENVRNKVITNYSSKNPGYVSLDFFDTFSDSVILFNKNNESLDIDCKVEEIPVWEAWRLYVNRMADLLKLDCYSDYDKKTEDYYWLKIFESTAGSYCIIKRKYNKNILKRLEIFNKELIDNDKELSDTCKKSYAIIKLALLARSKHDLALFEINLSIEERKKIVISWMKYFEKKVLFEEKMIIESNSFSENYMKNRMIHKKYLEISSILIIPLSNFIRLFFHYKELLNINYKFYNFHNSWRHVILLTISSLFKEEALGLKNFISKNILERIIRRNFINNLSKKEYIITVIDYWKLLR